VNNINLRQSRRFQLELLETRELLSVVGLPVLRAAEISPLAKAKGETIKGTLSGQGYVVPISTSQGTTYFTASGSTTALGSTTLEGRVSYSVNKQHSLKYTNGVGTLADNSGDFKVSFSGSGPKVVAGDYTFSVKASVIGGSGTGSFTGAAGSFTGTGSLNILTHAFSIKLTVTLKHI
jgi:hypothetical protein